MPPRVASTTAQIFAKCLSTKLACIRTFTQQFLSNLVWWQTPPNCICLIPVWMTLTSTQGHNYVRKQKHQHPFSRKFLISIWMNFGKLPWPVHFSKLMIKFVRMRTISRERERGLYFGGFIKTMFKARWHMVVCKLISFKLGMAADRTKLIPVWLISTFTQGHSHKRKLELVQSFHYKVTWSSLNIHSGWLCKVDDYY